MAGHGNNIESTDLGNGTRFHQVRRAIGGGRGGFGRALSRLANTAGVGGFALTVRTEAGETGPVDDVTLSIYLKDLYESMPSGRHASLDLGEGLIVTLQRDGEVRQYGGDLREADYRAVLPISEYLGVVARSRVDGSFEDRAFRIEGKQLDTLRDVLLRVAAAGSPLNPAPPNVITAAEHAVVPAPDAATAGAADGLPNAEDIMALNAGFRLGPPPLSTDSVGPVPPPAAPPVDAGDWVGLYHGAYDYKAEGDSFSVEVLLSFSANGTYALAYAEHWRYLTYLGGHFTTDGARITLLSASVGPDGETGPCTLTRMADGRLDGLAPCRGWYGTDGNFAPLPLLRRP